MCPPLRVDVYFFTLSIRVPQKDKIHNKRNEGNAYTFGRRPTLKFVFCSTVGVRLVEQIVQGFVKMKVTTSSFGLRRNNAPG